MKKIRKKSIFISLLFGGVFLFVSSSIVAKTNLEAKWNKEAETFLENIEKLDGILKLYSSKKKYITVSKEGIRNILSNIAPLDITISAHKKQTVYSYLKKMNVKLAQRFKMIETNGLENFLISHEELYHFAWYTEEYLKKVEKTYLKNKHLVSKEKIAIRKGIQKIKSLIQNLKDSVFNPEKIGFDGKLEEYSFFYISRPLHYLKNNQSVTLGSLLSLAMAYVLYKKGFVDKDSEEARFGEGTSIWQNLFGPNPMEKPNIEIRNGLIIEKRFKREVPKNLEIVYTFNKNSLSQSGYGVANCGLFATFHTFFMLPSKEEQEERFGALLQSCRDIDENKRELREKTLIILLDQSKSYQERFDAYWKYYLEWAKTYIPVRIQVKKEAKRKTQQEKEALEAKIPQMEKEEKELKEAYQRNPEIDKNKLEITAEEKKQEALIAEVKKTLENKKDKSEKEMFFLELFNDKKRKETLEKIVAHLSSLPTATEEEQKLLISLKLSHASKNLKCEALEYWSYWIEAYSSKGAEFKKRNKDLEGLHKKEKELSIEDLKKQSHLKEINTKLSCIKDERENKINNLKSIDKEIRSLKGDLIGDYVQTETLQSFLSELLNLPANETFYENVFMIGVADERTHGEGESLMQLLGKNSRIFSIESVEVFAKKIQSLFEEGVIDPFYCIIRKGNHFVAGKYFRKDGKIYIDCADSLGNGCDRQRYIFACMKEKYETGVLEAVAEKSEELRKEKIPFFHSTTDSLLNILKDVSSIKDVEELNIALSRETREDVKRRIQEDFLLSGTLSVKEETESIKNKIKYFVHSNSEELSIKIDHHYQDPDTQQMISTKNIEEFIIKNDGTVKFVCQECKEQKNYTCGVCNPLEEKGNMSDIAKRTQERLLTLIFESIKNESLK